MEGLPYPCCMKQAQQDQVTGAARRAVLHQLTQLILLGGVAIWLVIGDLRTRLHR